jgi:hypothetical protein
VTTSRRKPDGPRTRRQATTPTSPVPRPRTGDKELSETAEPYDLPFPDDRWPQGRPAYAVVVDQLRGWFPAAQPSLSEALDTGRLHPHEPQADPEAEP